VVTYCFAVITLRLLARTDSTKAWCSGLPRRWALGAGLLDSGLAHAAMAGLAAHRRRNHRCARQNLITQAFRRAPASVIAPFEYTALIWGVLLDWSSGTCCRWHHAAGQLNRDRRGLF
jgi:hypothetical protein